MSSFWVDDILPKPNSIGRLSLGLPIPEEDRLKEGERMETYRGDLDPDLLVEIKNFSSLNYGTSNSCYTILSESLVESLLSKEGVLTVYRRDGSQGITGILLNIPISIRMGKKKRIISSYSTHLVLDKNERSKGLAPKIMKSGINAMSSMGAVNCYYLTENSHHRSHLEVGTWYRPINLHLTDSIGYGVEGDYRSKRVTMKYSSRAELSYRKSSELDSRRLKEWNTFYIRWSRPISDDAISILNDQGQAVAIIHLSDYIMRIKGKEVMVTLLSYLCFLTDKSSLLASIFSTISFISKSRGSCMIYGYSIAKLADPKIRKGLSLMDSPNKQILEFYNSGLELRPEEINLPLW